MVIQILGPGCPNCERLEKNARQAAANLGLDVEFQKVTDMDEIVEMGVMRTPGFAIDGRLQKSGKVFSTEEIEESLKASVG